MIKHFDKPFLTGSQSYDILFSDENHNPCDELAAKHVRIYEYDLNGELIRTCVGFITNKSQNTV